MSSHSPLVSILIPAYNSAAWVEQTLRSAIAQTHESIEIILVDDGSTDDTADIAKSVLSSASPFSRVIRQPNSGASSARNRALENSSGAYLQFLDADDLLSPQKISLQIDRLLLAPPSAVASCRWGRFESAPESAKFVDDRVFADFDPVSWVTEHVGKLSMMHPAAWLVPRNVAEKAGPWNEELTLNDDGEYFDRVVLASSGIAFTDSAEAATYYRSGLTGSLSGRKSSVALQSLYRTGELVESRLLEAEDSPRTRQALADHWQHLSYEFYPDAPALFEVAAQRAEKLGGSEVPPPLGSKQQWLARFIGWKLTRQLAIRSQRWRRV